MRIHRTILAIVSRLVPGDARAEWRAEWEAEFHHRESSAAPWPHRRRRLDMIRRATGAFWDALWLQSGRWYSLRLFGRHWRLAVTAVLSLSVAMAATVIGFSAYSALLLRPPAVGDPGTLRFIHVRSPAEPFGTASFPEYAAYRARTRAFADIAAFPYDISSVPLVAGDLQQQVVATHVSNNFFSVLGITPQSGRLGFHTSSGEAANEVVVSNRLRRALGAGGDLVGRTIRLNGQPVTIIGIAPPMFGGMTWSFAPDVWMSLEAAETVLGTTQARLTDNTDRWLHMVGRLRPGVSAEQASIDLQLVAASLAREHPDPNTDRSAVVTPLRVTPPGEQAWTSMILGALILIVMLTLIVACANVTNLLLGLSTSRRHEMLVRAALGASRLQLVMPLLRESLVLGTASGALGFAAAWFALAKLAVRRPSLGAFLPPVSLDLRPDALVFTSTMVVALVVGLAVGLAPAVRAASEGLSGAINRERSASEPRKRRIRNVLVVIQMAVATVVLVGVGISVHSLVNLRHVSLGFSARNLVFQGVDMRRSGYDARTGPALFARMRERLMTMPGIEAVSLTGNVPLEGYGTDRTLADDEVPAADGGGVVTPYAVVDDHYFSTLGIGLLEGRTFDSRDRRGSNDVIVINATLARRRWPGRDPIGQRLRIDNGHRPAVVIGVVQDGTYGDVGEDQLPFMYVALAQHYQPDITLIARFAGHGAPRDAIMRQVEGIDPRLVPGGLGDMTLDELLGLSLLLPRVIVWTTIVFALLALSLAVLGLYSTVFYAVSQRRVEIGIRTALGATPHDLFALVLGESAWVVLAGAVAGLAAGLSLLPIASSIFYGIGRVEPMVLGAVALVGAMITLSTAYLVVRPWTRLTARDLLSQ